jgi:hypothetical protein
MTTLLKLDQGPYEITLDAWFSGPMRLSSLLDASLYQFSGGAYTRYVESLPLGSLSPTGVRLWVEGFQGTDPFTLTVYSFDGYAYSVKDANGNALALDGKTAQITPFQSSAFLSNTDGLVRSWHESRIILKDSQRAYLGGVRGLDAFSTLPSFGRSRRWSQVLDAYGIAAACLSGTSDYVFSDTTPPFLAKRNPAPSATGVSQNTRVYLSVADEFTSVEVVQLIIYLHNNNPVFNGAVFSGAIGWERPSICGGLISMERQVLDIQLIPKQPFFYGPVTVSVVATDIAGNLLSTSYSFIVGGGPVILGGFGTESFGVGPFGI